MLGLRTCVSLVLVLSLGGGALCVAQEADDRQSAAIQVWAIRATTKNKDISPELRGIADKLKKQFKYTGFKLERKATGTVAIGKAFTTGLIGDYQAKITPKRNDGKRVQLQVEVIKGESRVFNATVTLPAGQFQLAGGWSLGGGDALIMAVSAR